MEATHFVEVYKEPTKGKVKNGAISPIRYLTSALELSSALHFKTIAIWKIKPKQ